MRNIGLQFWLAKRSGDPCTRLHAKQDVRRAMKQNTFDYMPRGRGNRAWRRAVEIGKDPATIVWPLYCL